MAITNHERVGKALELLKAGLAPFVEREFKAKYWQRLGVRGAGLSVGDDRLDWQEADRRMGCCRACSWLMWEAWNEVFRKTLGQAERSLVSETARRAQQVGAPGGLLQRRRLPRARLRRAAADRRLGAAGRRDREDEDGTAARALRRAGAQREAQDRRHGHRERRDGQPEALARGGDAAQGRGQRPLPAGRVRRRPLAGASGRRHGRIPQPGRVLPPHLPDREPEGDAGRRRAAAGRRGRRPGGAAADQLRRRQDALDAGALPPVLRHRADRTGRASTR